MYDTDRENWKQKAYEILNDQELESEIGAGQNKETIYFNSLQGKYLNVGVVNDLMTHSILLFVISKHTHILGRFIRDDFESDFLLCKFEIPYESMKNDVFGYTGEDDVKME